MRLLIATHNHGKVREYRQLLYGLPHQLLSLDDVGIVDDVPETGHTYAENALLKARAYAQQSGLLTLADDSGLEVDALNGAPGVRSARYAGDHANDAAILHKSIDLVLRQALPGGQHAFELLICQVLCAGGKQIRQTRQVKPVFQIDKNIPGTMSACSVPERTRFGKAFRVIACHRN